MGGNSKDKMFVFIGFNNTNFDNFLMLEDFLIYKENCNEQEITISDVFYNGSQLLNFKFTSQEDTLNWLSSQLSDSRNPVG